jgi:hypothetical protein
MTDEKKIIRRIVTTGVELPSPELKRLGLTANPFPPDAILNLGSTDPRVNGDIFAEGVRKDVIETFERRVIGKGNFSGRARIGYLWAEGGPETGRGVGKTALLRYFQHKINDSWGGEYFGGNTPLCVLYEQPRQVPKDPVNYMAMFAIRNFQISGIMDSIILTLRLKSIEELLGQQKATDIANEAGSGGDDSYLDDNWLVDQSVDVGKVNQLVTEKQTTMRIAALPDIGIDQQIALAMANRDLLGYLSTLRSDNRLVAPHPPRDTKLHHRLPDIFFNQVMLALLVGDFKGVYLFVDDVENLVDQPGRKQQEIFAKTVGNCIFREETVAAKTRMLTIVLTTHENSARRLSQAWELAGLNASSPMTLDGPNTIKVPIPTSEGALDMMRAYLSHYRDTSKPVEDELHPFTIAASTKLVNGTGKHPRRFLSVANLFIDQACHEKINIIEEPFIDKYLSKFTGQAAEKIKKEESLLEIGLDE